MNLNKVQNIPTLKLLLIIIVLLLAVFLVMKIRRIRVLHYDFGAELKFGPHSSYGFFPGSLGGPNFWSSFPNSEKDLPFIAFTTSKTVLDSRRNSGTLSSSKDFSSFLEDLFSSPFYYFPGRKTVSISEFGSAKSKIPDYSLIEAELEKIIFPQISSLSSPIANPERASLFSTHCFSPDEFGHLWYAVGRIQAYEGKTKRSLKTMMCILLLASKAGTSLVDYKLLHEERAEITLTFIGASGLLEITPDLKLSKTELIEVVRLLTEIESKSFTFETHLQSESSAYLNLSADVWALMKKPSFQYSGEIPYSYIEAFSDIEFLKLILSVTHDPLVNAVKKPYFAAKQEINSNRLLRRELMKRPNTFGPHWLGYFFYPERYFLERTFFIEDSLFEEFYQEKVRSIELLHGAKISLALYSYRNELGTWPVDLNSVEKWIGASFSMDLFSDKPHFYQVSTAPVLLSVGEDGKLQTHDDLVFVPVWKNPSFSAVASSFGSNIALEPLF